MGWIDYNKIKKIGEGSFGSAWLVKHNRDSQSYVIKQINVSRMPIREREEARKEVAVLAQMKHPNIVSYIDSFEELGNLCIVMDYCEGGDLYNKIHTTRGVPLSEDQILDWFVQITLALKHVHDRKILHRDLKSQNIFLTKDGNIKLGDFGVAKVLGNTMEFARTAIGTPYYMSPEICERKPYNNKSDVWSLGCILYEMTNIKHPFEANNMHMLIVKILKANFEQVNPRYSYELRNLVACMLKRNPKERPSVNGILRKAFIMRRCDKFLTNDKLIEEFSHTVLHGENFKNKMQNPISARPNSAAVNGGGLRQVVNPSPRPGSAAVVAKPIIMGNNNPAGVQPKIGAYDPAKIYKNPVVRRESPVIQKSSDKKVVVDIKKRPPSAGPNRGVSVEREIGDVSDRKSYLEQQRAKKAFEEAVLLKKKHQELLEKQKIERIKKAREEGWRNLLSEDQLKKKEESSPSENEKESPPVKQSPPVYPQVNLEKDNDIKPKNNNNNNNKIYARFHQQLDEFADKRKPNVEKQDLISKANKAVSPNIFNNIINNNNKPIIKASPLLANDFIRRKEDFARNKARGKGLFNPIIPRPPLVKRDENFEYEEKLRQIRLRNYNNRRLVVNNSNDSKKPIVEASSNNDNITRLKKINALRQQSEEILRKKERLEMDKKRQAAYEKEKQYLNEKKNEQILISQQKPAPAVNITEVFDAIGIVGKQISKAEVLRNPNDNIVQTPRNHKKWKEGTDLTPLNIKTLINDQTIVENKSNNNNKEILISPRKIWDLPHETVIKALELADISSTNPALFESTLKPSSNKISNRGETFIVDKKEEKKIDESVLSNSSDLNNENPPSILNDLGILEITNKSILNNQLKPEKLATLKATKNLLLGITLGKFDPKSTKMLRTCSEPDMTKLFNDDLNKIEKEKIEDSEFKKTFNQENKDNFKRNTLCLTKARSFEDGLDNKIGKINEEEQVTNFSDEDKELIDLIESKFKFDGKDNEEEDDDVIDVRKTMENLLNESDSDSEKLSKKMNASKKFQKSKKNSNKNDMIKRKGVCFASENKLVSQLSVSKYSQIPFDSLEVNQRPSAILNDEMDCDNVSLNGENSSEKSISDSDTEFEDAVNNKIEIEDTVKAVASYHSIEEKRHKLENLLGQEKFIKGYPTIQNLILNEREQLSKTKNIEERKSYISFLKLFPNAKVELYSDLYDLIIADHEFNEN